MWKKQMYRADIDGLRAVAVLGVVFYHAHIPFLTGGFLGVDIFFVISGFLITGIILKELKTDTFSFLKFYERRARRILPALVIVVICTWVASWFLMFGNDFKDFSASMVAVVLFLPNLFFYLKSGYFDRVAEEKPLLHTWSLGVEEQFYIIFPIFLALLWKYRQNHRLIMIMLVCALLSLGLSEFLARKNTEANFYLPFSRAWELLIGAMIAVQNAKDSKLLKQQWRYDILSFLGVVLIISSFFLFDKNTPTPSLYTLIPVLGSGVILFFAHRGFIIKKVLSLRPLVWIGLISYSLYLWHVPVFVFMRRQTLNTLGFVEYIPAILLALLLSILTWIFVEQPFRNKNFITSRYFIFILGAGMCLILILGITGYASNDFRNLRVNEVKLAQKANILSTIKKSPFRKKCHAGPKKQIQPQDACIYNEGKPLEWAILGDSHIVELAYELSKKLEQEAVLHLSFSGCAPVFFIKSSVDGCTQWAKNTLDYILKTPSIHTVLIHYRYSSYFDKNSPKPSSLLMGKTPEEKQELFWQSLEKAIKLLVKNNKNVILIDPVPDISYHIERYIDLKPIKNGYIKTIPYSDYQARDLNVQNRIKFLSKIKGVSYIPTLDIFCDKNWCYGVKDNKALYFDDDHLSLYGASLVADRILRNLAPLP